MACCPLMSPGQWCMQLQGYRVQGTAGASCRVMPKGAQCILFCACEHRHLLSWGRHQHETPLHFFISLQMCWAGQWWWHPIGMVSWRDSCTCCRQRQVGLLCWGPLLSQTMPLLSATHSPTCCGKPMLCAVSPATCSRCRPCKRCQTLLRRQQQHCWKRSSSSVVACSPACWSSSLISPAGSRTPPGTTAPQASSVSADVFSDPVMAADGKSCYNSPTLTPFGGGLLLCRV